jgi:hypothetical protein
MSLSIFSIVAQALGPSMRQRKNCAVSAGTNGGGLASLAAPARIWKSPWRVASGTLRKSWNREPSLESCRLKASALQLANPVR